MLSEAQSGTLPGSYLPAGQLRYLSVGRQLQLRWSFLLFLFTIRASMVTCSYDDSFLISSYACAWPSCGPFSFFRLA